MSGKSPIDGHVRLKILWNVPVSTPGLLSRHVSEGHRPIFLKKVLKKHFQVKKFDKYSIRNFFTIVDEVNAWAIIVIEVNPLPFGISLADTFTIIRAWNLKIRWRIPPGRSRLPPWQEGPLFLLPPEQMEKFEIWKWILNNLCRNKKSKTYCKLKMWLKIYF